MNNDIDKYDIADLEGRIKIIKAIYTNNRDTKVLSFGLKDNDDLSFLSGKTKYIVEAKNYKNSADRYNEILINAHKIDRLEALGTKYYIGCSFDDGIVKLFDMKYLIKNNLVHRKQIKTKVSTVDPSKGYVLEDKLLFPKDEYFIKIDINNYKVLQTNVDKQAEESKP